LLPDQKVQQQVKANQKAQEIAVAFCEELHWLRVNV
jgi:hypothetical protein